MKLTALGLPLLLLAGVASIPTHDTAAPVTQSEMPVKFRVSINYGPNSVQPSVNCEWMAAVVSGGTAPFTWQWYIDGVPVAGNGGGPNDIYYTNTGTSFTLGVDVTDANNVTTGDSRFISVTGGAPYCPL